MERSLTVLLPVQDVQSTLTDTVVEVLDAAADLTDQFELLIIDDGSTDATSEVAEDLRRHYPQVRNIRHSTPLGWEASLRAGMLESQGEVVVVRDEGHLRLERLHRSSKPTRPNYLVRLKQLAARRK